jgi:hypothetical protein
VGQTFLSVTGGHSCPSDRLVEYHSPWQTIPARRDAPPEFKLTDCPKTSFQHRDRDKGLASSQCKDKGCEGVTHISWLMEIECAAKARRARRTNAKNTKDFILLLRVFLRALPALYVPKHVKRRSNVACRFAVHCLCKRKTDARVPSDACPFRPVPRIPTTPADVHNPLFFFLFTNRQSKIENLRPFPISITPANMRGLAGWAGFCRSRPI